MEKKKLDVKGSLKKKTSSAQNDKKPAKKAPTTRAGKIFRGPLFWIVIAILAVSIFGQITSAGNRYTEIGTSQAIDAISQSKVESAVLVDKSQKIRLILKAGNLIKGASKVEASYIARQEPTLVDALSANPPVKGWNVDVPSQSLFVSFLFSIAPILLIGFLFFFLQRNICTKIIYYRGCRKSI
jgi:cell division protease FtsH